MKKAMYCMLALMAVNVTGAEEGKRGYMGVQLSTVEHTGEHAKTNEVRISHVYEGTGADEAGLESGDVVLKVNGVDIDSHKELTDALSEYVSGDTINILVRRGDLDMAMDVVLGDQPEARHFGNRWVEVLHKDRAFAGLELMDLNDQLAEFFDVEGGTLVKKVTEDGPAAQAGIKAGDIILKWGQESISKQHQIRTLLGKIKPGDQVSVTVLRKGKHKTMEVTTETAKGIFQNNFHFDTDMKFEFEGLEGLQGLEGLHGLPNFELRFGDGDIHVDMKELGEELGKIKIDIHEKVKEIEKEIKKKKEEHDR